MTYKTLMRVAEVVGTFIGICIVAGIAFSVLLLIAIGISKLLGVLL
jgi:hypothetical protein